MTLAQEIIQTCINRPELQTEIYCQLIKQTSKYRSLPLAEGAVSKSIIHDVTRNISFSSALYNMSFSGLIFHTNLQFHTRQITAAMFVLFFSSFVI